jgi:hypothetical protein
VKAHLARFIAIVLPAAFAAIGCQSPSAGPRRLAPSYRANPVVQPGDPAPHPIYLIQLDVYQINVPFGSVSGNQTFWSRITRAHIDPRAEALLRRNGFQIGQGKVSEWPFFANILNMDPGHTKTTSLVAYQEERDPLITRPNQPARNLFYFDASGQLVGRSFDEAEDEMLLSFWPTPRHDGQVHIQLVPGVQSEQTHMQYYPIAGQPGIRTVRPEFFYDLKLESDIDVNHFLIVATSPQARWESSLGNAFLVDDSGGSRTELVLIFVARPIGAPSLLGRASR